MSPKDDVAFSLGQYKSVGGLKNAINLDAESVFSHFQDDQTAIKTLFQRITEKGEGDKPIQKPEAMSILASIAGIDSKRLGKIVDGFVERDLLVLRETENEGVQVDLPHECLTWKWERLGGWIDKEAGLAKSLQFIQDSAKKKQWLTGSALAEARRLLSTPPRSARTGAEW